MTRLQPIITWLGNHLDLALPSIFLVFLAPQVSYILEHQTNPVVQVAGIALVVAFGALYLWAFVLFAMPIFGPADPRVWWVFAGLTAISGLLALFNGPLALATFPFQAAAACYLLRLPMALLVGAGYTAVSVAILALTGTLLDNLFFPILIVGVFLGNFVLASVFIFDANAMRMSSELARTQERDHLARDVHDSLGHTLTVVAIKAELASRLIDTNPNQARAELAQLRDHIRDALTDVRSVVTGLKTHDLPTQIDALHCTMPEADISLTVVGSPDTVPPQHQHALAWILREAGTNVLRHSGATQCTVTFRDGAMTVHDNGDGIPNQLVPDYTTDPGSNNTSNSQSQSHMHGQDRDQIHSQVHGHGLTGMLSRAQDNNMTAHITTPPAGGTLVTIEWTAS